MKIAYVTTYESNNINNWSGVGYHIARAFERQSINIKYICPLKEANSLFFKSKQYLYLKIFNKKFLRDREPFVLKSYAKQVASKLSSLDIDYIFSPGTIPISYLEHEKPIAFWTDATFAGMINFYPNFTNLCKETIYKGNTMEKIALERCRVAIYSSEWAAQTAINNYKINPEKIHVVPFGANIECNRSVDDIKDIVSSRPTNVCKLLFVGVNWVRKDGNIALDIAKCLNKSGIKTELHIVGCKPIINESLPKYVELHGFLDKSLKEGINKLNRLFAESHFLILPSVAETFGTVICEASSYGVPSITTNVGGITTAVKDGFNGKTFSKDTSIEEYCTYISNLWSNYSKYKKVALSSFNEYQSRLNWTIAGKSVKKILEDTI